MIISSDVAYAQAARDLSSALANILSLNERLYGEDRGESADSAVKDLVESPVGTALIKTYGGADADTISVAVQVKDLEDGSVKVYAQEFSDPVERTLSVRLLMSRDTADYLLLSRRPVDDRSLSAMRDRSVRSDSALEGRLGGGFSLWRGRHIRMSSQDVRVGRRNEFTLWVEDDDAGLTWVEQWPLGGADLLQGGQTAAKYVFDKVRREWTARPLAAGAE
jgi:hypothetical protein